MGRPEAASPDAGRTFGMQIRGAECAALKPGFVALAALPMACAALGAMVDQRRAMGFTIWRSACRAAGLSLHSVAAFTLELLPTAVIGALLGGLIVLAAGFRRRGSFARGALAAHSGCVLAMPAGLLLCALAWPWPLTLAADVVVTTCAALSVWWITRIRKAAYADGSARGVPRIPRGAAAAENFPVNHSWNSHDCN